MPRLGWKAYLLSKRRTLKRLQRYHCHDAC
jgi:hypothetical protein